MFRSINGDFYVKTLAHLHFLLYLCSANQKFADIFNKKRLLYLRILSNLDTLK